MKTSSFLKKCIQKKVFRILLFAELALFLIGCLGFLRPEQEMVLVPRTESEQEEQTAYLAKNLSLKRGTYRIDLDYTAGTEENVFMVEDTETPGKSILFGAVTLNRGHVTERMELWVVKTTDHVTMYLANNGDEALRIHELRLIRTYGDVRIALFMILVVSLIVNFLYCFRCFCLETEITAEKKLSWSLLVIAFALFSLPCFVDYNLWGDDWGFHLLRVEGLISGLKDGQFPVRIQGNWLRGYGYAVSVFYSDLLLTIPMVFRLIGFTVVTSHRLFLILINLATLWIAYAVFKRVFDRVSTGAVTAVLYLFGTYHIHNIYVREALGETLAMVFLPLVFYGFYRIFTDDTQTAGYRYSWIRLTIALSLVINVHVLTCEMLAFCILLICLICLKRVFRRETFLELLKTVVATALLNLWYLFPFLDYLANEKFNVGNSDTMAIQVPQEWGTYPAHFFSFFYSKGRSGMGEGYGMYLSGGYSLGAALMVVVILWLLLEVSGKLRKKEFVFVKLGRLMFGFTLLLLVLTSRYFPWNALQNMGGIAQTLVISLQFPYRFLSIATMTSVVLAGVLLCYVRSEESQSVQRMLIIGLTGITLVTGSFHIDQIMMGRGLARVYNKQSMGTIHISNAEYLPYKADLSLMHPDHIVAGEGVEITAFEKEKDLLHATVSVKCSEKESFLELPILYYRGYVARDLESGEQFAVQGGPNSDLRVLLPAGYSGTFRVYFKEPFLWRLAEGISVVTLLFILWVMVYRRKKGAQYAE